MDKNEFLFLRQQIKKPENIMLKTKDRVSYKDESGRTFIFDGPNQILLIGNKRYTLDIHFDIKEETITSKYDLFNAMLIAFPSDTIIDYCNTIYNFRKTGLIDQESDLFILCETLEVDERLIEGFIMQEAHNRFHNLVSLLFSDWPTGYLK